MTELEARMERLRNRTEKDEKEFQNYYATLETGGRARSGESLVGERDTTGGSQVLRGFLTVSMET